MISKVICTSKIHRAIVTESDLHYIGSITIDSELIKAAGLVEYEKVQVVNVTNGSRLETYTILGEPNSGTICINGAASHLMSVGDIIIIIGYSLVETDKVNLVKPKIVHVNDNNKIINIHNSITHEKYESA